MKTLKVVNNNLFKHHAEVSELCCMNRFHNYFCYRNLRVETLAARQEAQAYVQSLAK